MKAKKTNRKVLLSLLLCSGFIASPLEMWAADGNAVVTGVQQAGITVTGVVKDANGEPIIGANVVEAGTTNGTIMEAEYMLTKNLNAGHTLEYWQIVREAAGFTGLAADPQTTIAATDMQQEKLDWGAYSAGKLLDDPILYNIRRERRCELMGEAKRWDDLIRWRALDQLMTEPYHIEGFHLWNSDMTHYYGFQPESYDGSGNAVVSSPDLSEYLRPYEKNMTANNLYRNGYTWHLAHYLQPLPTEEMRLTSPDQLSVEQSRQH